MRNRSTILFEKNNARIHGEKRRGPGVYLSRELKSLQIHIRDLGYATSEDNNILKDAKFACLYSEKNVAVHVERAVNSGVPIILVSNSRHLDKDLEKNGLDYNFPTHISRHARFTVDESKHVITWIDHCFEKTAKKWCEKRAGELCEEYFKSLFKIFIGKEKKGGEQ